MTRRSLGEDASAAAWEAGEALTPEQAVAEALALAAQTAGLAASLSVRPRVIVGAARAPVRFR